MANSAITSAKGLRAACQSAEGSNEGPVGQSGARKYRQGRPCAGTTGAGEGAGTVLVVLERAMQPGVNVIAARTNPIAKNFIMQVP